MAKLKKLKECSHLNECQQKITQNDLYLCRGELDDWDQEDCFKYNDLAQEVASRKGAPIASIVKTPSELEKEVS